MVVLICSVTYVVNFNYFAIVPLQGARTRDAQAWMLDTESGPPAPRGRQDKDGNHVINWGLGSGIKEHDLLPPPLRLKQLFRFRVNYRLYYIGT